MNSEPLNTRMAARIELYVDGNPYKLMDDKNDVASLFFAETGYQRLCVGHEFQMDGRTHCVREIRLFVRVPGSIGKYPMLDLGGEWEVNTHVEIEAGVV